MLCYAMRYSIKRQFVRQCRKKSRITLVWQETRASFSTIKYKTKSNLGLVIHVFAHFPDFEFLLVMSNSKRVSQVTGITLAFHYFALWLVQKTHISDTKLTLSATWSLLFFPPLEECTLRALYLTVSFSFAFSLICPVCRCPVEGQLQQ